MASRLQNQEEMPDKLFRKKLAAAVRSIQWSYAIFWSISAGQPGLLKWGDGYYNGDIKTRKTIQPLELSVDQMGLQRTKQLTVLYESLSSGDSNLQSKRLSAALSPEDLSDAEWYYLVCMSFTFNPGQGLPGRALSNGNHIWLCNAHFADSKVFSRSLLAKSASIQTVVCFPLMGGVLELGVNEMIPEDPSLIQHVKTSFLEFPVTFCSDQSTTDPHELDDDDNHIGTDLDHDMANSIPLEKLNSAVECEMQKVDGSSAIQFSLPPYRPKEETILQTEGIEEVQEDIFDELKADSSINSSSGCGVNQHTDDSYIMEEPNGASQLQSWRLMDDEHSCDCVSQSLACPVKAIPSPKGENFSNGCFQDQQESNNNKLSLLDIETNDSHYAKILSAIFSHRLTAKDYSYSVSFVSSFVAWNKVSDSLKPKVGASQQMLKKVLFKVASMHSDFLQKTKEDLGCKRRVWKMEENKARHACSERSRREKLDEKLLILRTLVPSVSKVDQASILCETIEYVKELQQRVEELEACRESGESDTRHRRRHQDIIERTSDNYGHCDLSYRKKSSINKRKASNIDEADAELKWVLSKDCLADMTVTLIDKEVLIEMQCPWRECLLLEIVDAISILHLDAHEVQSTIADGLLTLTLKSKFRGAIASVRMIKQALQRVVAKC